MIPCSTSFPNYSQRCKTHAKIHKRVMMSVEAFRPLAEERIPRSGMH